MPTECVEKNFYDLKRQNAPHFNEEIRIKQIRIPPLRGEMNGFEKVEKQLIAPKFPIQGSLEL